MYVKSEEFRGMLAGVLSNYQLDFEEPPLFDFSKVLDKVDYGKLEQLKIVGQDVVNEEGTLSLPPLVKSSRPFLIFTRDYIVDSQSEILLCELNYHIDSPNYIRMRNTLNLGDILMDRFRFMSKVNKELSLIMKLNNAKPFKTYSGREEFIKKLCSYTKLKNNTHYVLMLEIVRLGNGKMSLQFENIGDCELDYQSEKSLEDYCNRHGSFKLYQTQMA